jgi:cytochrome c-type biogenesis protein CcmH
MRCSAERRVGDALDRWRAFATVATLLMSLLSTAVCQSAGTAGAIEAFQFDNTEQEARYRALTEEFRCPKCLNTNLAGSDAPIAADLRATVHRLILEGASDQAIRDYLRERYGDFVLYDPPLRGGTVLLWLIPAALLASGVAVVVVMARRRRGETPIDAVDRARLDALLGEPAPSERDS